MKAKLKIRREVDQVALVKHIMFLADFVAKLKVRYQLTASTLQRRQQVYDKIKLKEMGKDDKDKKKK